jgi:hypothetical protein
MVDGSAWGSSPAGKGSIVRFDPATQLAEIYHVPAPVCAARLDIDKGVIWCRSAAAISAASTGRNARDRSSGPNATGDHCPEGWSFYQYPGPGFRRHRRKQRRGQLLHLGRPAQHAGSRRDVPISTGNENDALLALVDGKWVVLRVPYPLSFYAKGLDGRIDDPAGGWKGRGLWTTSGDRTPWLKEGGKGTVPIAFHFQLRPDPLAE